MDDNTILVTPKVRIKSSRQLSGTRKRRHSSLQLENRSTSSVGVDGPKRGSKSKLQIFKVFGVHLPLLLQKERTLMGHDDDKVTSPKKAKKTEETEEKHTIPRIVTITVEHLNATDGKNK